jgi:glycogen debranching enzyme
MNDTAHPPAHWEHEDRYPILARSSLTLSGARVLKHGDTFAVFDRYGDICSPTLLGAEGLYHEGARFLSLLRMRVARERLLLLGSTVREDNILLTADLMNPHLASDTDQAHIPHGALHVLRSAFLWNAACHQHIQVANYAESAIDVCIEFEIGADFADVFEVRGTQRARRGSSKPPEHVADGAMLLSYVGLDGVWRRTRVRFEPQPDARSADRVRFELHLRAKQVKDLYLTISCEMHRTPEAIRVHATYEQAYAEASSAIKHYEQRDCHVHSSNEMFNAWVQRSIADLRMLISQTPQGPYPYAGVPWYSTPFGRDGIITALQALWVNPDLARGVLTFLAALQATRDDPDADAEPGKILHEMRSGEMASLREIPFGKYYGSVDSTPLFIMLARSYYDATGDLAFVESIWSHVERALDWLDGPADPDGDGFVEYGCQSSQGLVQQGWKDSHDSVFHADGTPAEGPIAICEVQGYAYAARRGAAVLAAALGNAKRAVTLHQQADAMRVRFDRAFWCDDLATYALALDGHKRACRVRASNAGHALYTGIALPQRALPLADQLLAADMYSGWGIRTLASSEQRYNPMSYHNGSVWPHDNALIAAGFARYGLKQHASRVMTGLFDASLFVELNRLPELFCGFARRPGEGPTAYPVACSPQAWAAGAPFMLLQAVLGLTVEARRARVRFDFPALPPFLEEVSILNLRVKDGGLDLDLHRYPDNVGIKVGRRRGRVQVLSVK